MTNLDELVKLEAERAELIAKNEAATSWGAAVGARSERIKELDNRISILRRIASSDGGVKGEPEPVAWADKYGETHPITAESKKVLSNNPTTEPYWSRFSIPLYTSPPADAGMREAFIRVLASLAAAISILERTPKAKKAVASDKMFATMLDDYRKALEAGRAALVAPGATTKYDVEALAATTAERPGTVTSEPEPSTSGPSSTRSEVTCPHGMPSSRRCSDCNGY